MTANVYPCKFHDGANNNSTLYINKDLTEEIKECFHPMKYYSAVFDPVAETLTIFKAKAP
jgi:hypothetical protein